jgi:hypothetical protein
MWIKIKKEAYGEYIKNKEISNPYASILERIAGETLEVDITRSAEHPTNAGLLTSFYACFFTKPITGVSEERLQIRAIDIKEIISEVFIAITKADKTSEGKYIKNPENKTHQTSFLITRKPCICL